MINRYSPPKAAVEDASDRPIHNEQYKREKGATRPFGVVAVVFLFGLFSVLGAAFLALEQDWWVAIYIALTVLLVYWFRRLWWGDNRERRIAVFVGFLGSLLTYLGSPEGPIHTWSVSEAVSLAESCYFLLSACYLIYARNHPFFACQQATKNDVEASIV